MNKYAGPSIWPYLAWPAQLHVSLFSRFCVFLHQLRKRSYIAVTSYDKKLVRRDVRMKGEGIFKIPRARFLLYYKKKKKSCKYHSGLFAGHHPTDGTPFRKKGRDCCSIPVLYFLQVEKVILEKRQESAQQQRQGKGISSGRNRIGDAVSFRSTSNLAHIQQELSDR